MPKVGDEISLREWTGKPYRSKQRVLRESIISDVETVEIQRNEMYLGGRWIPYVQMFEFAKADGFIGVNDMIGFFHYMHGLPFVGILIKWPPL